MRTYKEVKHTEMVRTLDSATCDYCHRPFTAKEIRCNGVGHVLFGFGWGSQFDSCTAKLDVCDKCFAERFGPRIKDQLIADGYDLERLEKLFGVKI